MGCAGNGLITTDSRPSAVSPPVTHCFPRFSNSAKRPEWKNETRSCVGTSPSVSKPADAAMHESSSFPSLQTLCSYAGAGGGQCAAFTLSSVVVPPLMQGPSPIKSELRAPSESGVLPRVSIMPSSLTLPWRSSLQILIDQAIIEGIGHRPASWRSERLMHPIPP